MGSDVDQNCRERIAGDDCRLAGRAESNRLVRMDRRNRLLAEVSAEQKREMQLLARRGAALDHPVSTACLETRYLKCMIARVR